MAVFQLDDACAESVSASEGEEGVCTKVHYFTLFSYVYRGRIV